MPISYLISGKVRKMISQDASQTQYNIKQGKYSKEFIDHFFNSISQRFSLNKNFLHQYLSIMQELQIDKLRNPLRSFIISDLYDHLGGKNEISIEEKFSYICQNIQKVDTEELTKIPFEFIDELISNSKFHDENDFVHFLLKNKRILGFQYFEKVDFDKLTNCTIIELISEFQIDDSSNLNTRILNKLLSRIKKGMNKKIIINILFVTVDNSGDKKHSIDFNFIDDLNENKMNQNHLIHYRKIYHIDFQNKIKNDPNYLINFDMILLGGGNSFGENKVVNEEVKEALKNYHKTNGIFLFLHDALYSHDLNAFKELSKFIGDYDEKQMEIFTKVKLSESNNNDEILHFPFEISKEDITVADTHQIPIFNSRYVVLYGYNNNNEKRSYYAECIEEKIANCEIGHTFTLGNDEQKLLYNIICHLYKHCRKI